MLVSLTTALLMLADPAGPPQTAGEPKVIVDASATVISPAADPAVRAEPPTQPPAPATPPPPTISATLPPPASADEVGEAGEARPLPSPPVHPNAGFGLEIGFARGGDRFLTIAGPGPAGSNEVSAAAGDGIFFSLAGSWTPYWSRTGIGVGVYARAGAKYVAISNGTTSASFMRCPLAAAAQLLVPVGRSWFVLGRLGVITQPLEEVATTSAGGVHTSRDFSPRLGTFIDAGVSWTPSEHASVALIARYEVLDVSYAGGDTSANNLGGLAAVYYRF